MGPVPSRRGWTVLVNKIKRRRPTLTPSLWRRRLCVRRRGGPLRSTGARATEGEPWKASEVTIDDGAVTPFKDGEIDEPAYRALIDWQISSGAHGLVPVGTTGESPTLSIKEHTRAVDSASTKRAAGFP